MSEGKVLHGAYLLLEEPMVDDNWWIREWKSICDEYEIDDDYID